MPRCLFCLREESKDEAIRLTDEHVFPAALGGNLVVESGTCEACNHGSSRFEQALASELRPLRMMFQIPDRNGNVPHTSATFITTERTYTGHIRADGTLSINPSKTEEITESGHAESVYHYLSDAARESLRQRAKKNGLQMIETPPGDPVLAEVHIGGDLMTICSQEGLRTAAKIAYVGLARLTGHAFASGEAFGAIRQFIAEGRPEGLVRTFVNNRYLEYCAQGPHQHSISIAARQDRHRVDAIVRLFGALSYAVVLSDRYEGADFFDTLVLDASRGELNPVLVTHPNAELHQIEDVVTSTETVWDNCEAFARSFCAFLDRIFQREALKESAARE